MSWIMQFTRFTNIPALGHLPLVPAVLLHDAPSTTSAEPRVYVGLKFIVDTAAKYTIVTPKNLAKLRYEDTSTAWNKLLRPRSEPVDTVLGDAYLLEFRENPRLRFKAVDGSYWDKSLEELMFVDENRRRQGAPVSFALLPYSILGQDILRQCGVLCDSEGGIIMPEAQIACNEISKLERQAKRKSKKTP